MSSRILKALKQRDCRNAGRRGGHGGTGSVHPAAANAAEGGASAGSLSPVRATSLATLLARHILRDGELVLLMLKPSGWFIPLSSLRFAAVVAIAALAAILLDVPRRTSVYLEAATFLIAGRITWSVLQWMGRVYILTDQRIVRLGGVFSAEVFDCPLRKVARVRMYRTMRERLLRLGSIEIVSSVESCGRTVWQTIARPREVHQTILATLSRAQQRLL